MTTRRLQPTNESRPTVPFPKIEGQFFGWGPRIG